MNNKQDEITLRKFVFNIQRKKMKELRDNEKDEVWEFA